MKLIIKETKVSYKEGRYFYEKMFIKASSQEGNVCLLNGELISPEEGNKIFIDLKKKENFSFSVSQKEVEKEELISSWRRKIDLYTDYIENVKQQEMAEKRNEEIREIISAISEL